MRGKGDALSDLKTEGGCWIECAATNKPLLTLQIKSNIFLLCPAPPPLPPHHKKICHLILDYFKAIFLKIIVII